MRKDNVFVLVCIMIVLSFSFSAYAGTPMTSQSYAITTSVISGGGAPMGSTSYKMNSTLGQSSPLMDPEYPPESDSYWLDPGFWYTLVAGVPGCDLASFANAFGSISGDGNYDGSCDFDDDFDVDGTDLAMF